MTRGRYDWAKTARELRQNPGVWAVVIQSGEAPSKRAAQDAARYIRQGSRNMPKGEFTAASSGDRVYAMYVGEAEDA